MANAAMTELESDKGTSSSVVPLGPGTESSSADDVPGGPEGYDPEVCHALKRPRPAGYKPQRSL